MSKIDPGANTGVGGEDEGQDRGDADSSASSGGGYDGSGTSSKRDHRMDPKDKSGNKSGDKFQFAAKGSSSEALGLQDWALGLIPIAFWGTAAFFTAEALEFMHPATLAWLRITVGFLFFASLPIKKPSLERSFTFKDWASAAIMGTIWIGLPFTLFSIGQQWIDSSLAGMMIGSHPIVTVVMASFFLRALPTKRNSLGLMFGMVGIVVTAWPSLTSADNTTVGVILIFLAILCYGFAVNFGIPLTQKWGSYFLTYWTLAVASIVTTPYGIYGLFQSDHTVLAYIYIAILGVGATAITPFAFATLAAKVGATRASSVNFIVPLVALYAGAFIRDEMIHGLSLIGLALILIGIGTMGGRDDRH